jgi:hypothetical protein
VGVVVGSLSHEVEEGLDCAVGDVVEHHQQHHAAQLWEYPVI